MIYENAFVATDAVVSEVESIYTNETQMKSEDRGKRIFYSICENLCSSVAKPY